jgi:hypothetical protein
MIVEAVLLDFANTVVQYDRPQMQAARSSRGP